MEHHTALPIWQVLRLTQGIAGDGQPPATGESHVPAWIVLRFMLFPFPMQIPLAARIDE
jgi:hypothetical protein